MLGSVIVVREYLREQHVHVVRLLMLSRVCG